MGKKEKIPHVTYLPTYLLHKQGFYEESVSSHDCFGEG